MNFFKRYLSKNIDFYSEIVGLESLLKDDTRFYYSIYDYVERRFLSWSLRGTAISLDEFLRKSGIQSILDKISNFDEIDLNDFIEYLEYVKNLINFYDYDVNAHGNNSNRNAIENNLSIILTKLNFDFKWIQSDFGVSYAICIENDFQVREAAESLNDENLAEKIYYYNHHSVKGNLYEKSMILSRLYLKFEQIRDKLEKTEAKDLCSLIGYLSQRFPIRHAPKNKEAIIVDGFSNQDTEKIYDEMYKSFLIAISINDYNENYKEHLKNVKKRFEGK